MGLFVVGMHRSGTSAATEALATMPFELPDEADLVGGDESNPRGHFEVQALMDLTEELLTRAGGAWYAPTRAAITSITELVDPTYGLEPRARRTFLEAYSTDRWLMKDPRLCLTLPFWREVASAPQAAVLLRRDPVSVAHSIRDRNGLALRHGVAIWERYTRTALAGLADLPLFVIDYDDLLAGAEHTEALVEFAVEQLGPAAGDAETADRMARFLSVLETDLRHHRGHDEASIVLSTQQHQLLEVLGSLDGGHDGFEVPSLGRETPGLDLLFEAAVSLYELNDSIAEESFARGHASMLDQFRASEAAYEERLQEARDYIDEQSDALDEVRRSLSDEHENVARIEAESDKRINLIEQERTAIEDRHLDEIERLRAMLTDAEVDLSGLDHLQDQVTDLRIDLETAIHTRNLTAQDLAELYSRPAVKWVLRFADRLGRSPGSGTEDDEHTETPVVPPPRQADWDHVRSELRAGTMQRRLTVLIPIYNAADAVQRCLEAVDRFTPSDVDIVLIDDASTDERIDLVIDQLRSRSGVRIIRNSENLGFPATVNRGLDEVTEGDVIILNSDTQVTPRWTERLRLAAIERPGIGTVTPLSDHAGVFSFASPVPTGLHHGATIAARVARASHYLRPTGPTGNGFCLYVRAEALAEVPRLDHEGFPRGYGEENDFCMKLRSAGFEHVVADDVAVFHEESASFGDAQRHALITDGLAVLAERYPDYASLAEEFVASTAFVAARSIAGAAATDDGDEATLPRVLHVLHAGGGGTEYFARDLAEAAAGDEEPLLLMPDGQTLRLWRYEGPEWVIENEWHMSRPWDIRQFHDDEAAAIALEVLTRYDISLVHIQHLIGLTLDLPELADAIGLPVVMSLHDFYLACPSVNLLDEQLRYCRGVCTEGEGRCPTPVFLPNDLPLKHRFVHLWRHETTKLFETIPRFVTPSNDTRDRYIATFGADVGSRIDIIEHGRDFRRQRAFARAPRHDEPVTLLLVGGINQSKGATLAADIAEAGLEAGVRLEILGKVEPGYEHVAHGHGEYQRDELMARLAVIRPTFIGVFSLWPETHCYVLSEAWAAGIPVITGPLGAPAERVHEHGGGLVVDELDPEVIVHTAAKYGRDRLAYADLARTATLHNVRGRGAMAADWLALYDELRGDVSGWTR
ncbi:MAG: glycosyltransferase [Acidimicrobiales bacterium]